MQEVRYGVEDVIQKLLKLLRGVGDFVGFFFSSQQSSSPRQFCENINLINHSYPVFIFRLQLPVLLSSVFSQHISYDISTGSLTVEIADTHKRTPSREDPQQYRGVFLSWGPEATLSERYRKGFESVSYFYRPCSLTKSRFIITPDSCQVKFQWRYLPPTILCQAIGQSAQSQAAPWRVADLCSVGTHRLIQTQLSYRGRKGRNQ